MQPLHKFQFSSFFVHCLFSWPWFSHTQKKPLKQSWRLFKHTIFLRWSLWFHSLLFSTSERFSKLWKFLKKKKWQQQGRPLNEFLSSNFSIICLNLKVSNATTSKRNSGFHETDSRNSQRNLKRWMSWFVVKTIHASWILNSRVLTLRQCSKENLQPTNSNHWIEWPVKEAELQNLQERQYSKECPRSWHKTGKCLNLFQSPLDDLNCEKSILTRKCFRKRCNRFASPVKVTYNQTDKPKKRVSFVRLFFWKFVHFQCRSLYKLPDFVHFWLTLNRKESNDIFIKYDRRTECWSCERNDLLLCDFINKVFECCIESGSDDDECSEQNSARNSPLLWKLNDEGDDDTCDDRNECFHSEKMKK